LSILRNVLTPAYAAGITRTQPKAFPDETRLVKEFITWCWWEQ